jgi:hypothetical protein
MHNSKVDESRQTTLQPIDTLIIILHYSSGVYLMFISTNNECINKALMFISENNGRIANLIQHVYPMFK